MNYGEKLEGGERRWRGRGLLPTKSWLVKELAISESMM
jgi:hypothetical protein